MMLLQSSDAVGLMMSGSGKDAELYFSCEQFQECAQLLELGSHTLHLLFFGSSYKMCDSATVALTEHLPFTRAQWRITANLLTCRIQVSLDSLVLDYL